MRQKLLIVLFWLGVWQLAACLVNNQILAAGPVETGLALCRLVRTGEFWLSVLNSLARIFLGFAAGSAAGILCAATSWKVRWVRVLLTPFVTAVKAVPVASFAILVLIFAGSRGLSFFIAAMVAFPILYINTLNGLSGADRRMLEVAEVFRMRFRERLRYLWIPCLRPFLAGAVSLAAGMCFKAGVAAEVIGQPQLSMGNGLYRAKVYLETPEVLAWTLVVVLISYVIDRVIAAVSGTGKREGQAAPGNETRQAVPEAETSGREPSLQESALREPAIQESALAESTAQEPAIPEPSMSQAAMPEFLRSACGARVTLTGVSRRYDSLAVLKNVSLSLEPGGRYALTGPSGAGKTTLLRLLMGLEAPDTGSVVCAVESEKRTAEDGKRSAEGGMRTVEGKKPCRASVVFQEDRLFEEATVLDNLKAVCPGEREEVLEEALRCLLPKECFRRPAGTLSGGMKRRLCLARACAAPSELLLLDEPFTGLDEQNRRRAAGFLLRYAGPRTVVITGHGDDLDGAGELLRFTQISV